MKYFSYILIFYTAVSYGTTLDEMIILSEKNPSIQAAMQQAKVYEKLHNAAKAENYPSLDVSYGATYLYEDPVMYFAGSSLQVQAKNLYTGTAKLTYPLFTGAGKQKG